MGDGGVVCEALVVGAAVALGIVLLQKLQQMEWGRLKTDTRRDYKQIDGVD